MLYEAITPRILDVAGRLADQARDAGWTFEDYLAAVLEREVSARNASGAEMRIRSAGFGARKTLEDFDFDAQPAIRNQVASLRITSYNVCYTKLLRYANHR